MSDKITTEHMTCAPYGMCQKHGKPILDSSGECEECQAIKFRSSSSEFMMLYNKLNEILSVLQDIRDGND